MRQAEVTRNTLETRICLKMNLDGTGKISLDTGVPFLDHMLEQVARHGMIDLDVSAKGDLHIDAHHTVEDIGITVGQAFAQAVGDKKGLRRYGHSYVPLDEALSRVVVDLSGRPGMEFNVKFRRARIGEFDVDLINEFFQGFVNHALVTLHIENLSRTILQKMQLSIYFTFRDVFSSIPEIPSRRLNSSNTASGLKLWCANSTRQ